MAEKIKYSTEFVINSSPEFLFNYISTPSGLMSWFADDVDIEGDVFTFQWEGSQEKARLMTKRQNKFIKFHWIERPGNETLSLEIQQDELTGDVALVISDFEFEDQIQDSQRIYEVCIDKLKQTIGG